MKGGSLRTWLIAGLSGFLVVGCRSSPDPHCASDPLLVANKPVRVAAANAEPKEIATHELSPPEMPPFAVATAPVPFQVDPETGLTAHDWRKADPNESRTVRVGKIPLAGTFTSFSQTLSKDTALPPIRRLVPEPFAHAPDFSWVQGRLTKTARGEVELRYCPPGQEDATGGVVVLDPDVRLDQFRADDQVLVEGVVLPSEAPVLGSPAHYRIQSIWLVKRRAPTPVPGNGDKNPQYAASPS
jgi:hypothetical protein